MIEFKLSRFQFREELETKVQSVFLNEEWVNIQELLNDDYYVLNEIKIPKDIIEHSFIKHKHNELDKIRKDKEAVEEEELMKYNARMKIKFDEEDRIESIRLAKEKGEMKLVVEKEEVTKFCSDEILDTLTMKQQLSIGYNLPREKFLKGIKDIDLKGITPHNRPNKPKTYYMYLNKIYIAEYITIREAIEDSRKIRLYLGDELKHLGSSELSQKLRYIREVSRIKFKIAKLDI